jgi:hypothetical protein
VERLHERERRWISCLRTDDDCQGRDTEIGKKFMIYNGTEIHAAKSVSFKITGRIWETSLS